MRHPLDKGTSANESMKTQHYLSVGLFFYSGHGMQVKGTNYQWGWRSPMRTRSGSRPWMPGPPMDCMRWMALDHGAKNIGIAF